MKKLLVETTGNFSLIDGTRGLVDIRSTRPTVVVSTSFVQNRIALGQIKVLAELPEEATDEDWVKFLEESDGDVDLARESFVSSFGDPEFDVDAAVKRIKELGGKANRKMSVEKLKALLAELEGKADG